MWIKNATVFSFDPKSLTSYDLQGQQFSPVGSAAPDSCGWGVVRDDQLVYAQGKHHLLQFVQEKKILPASAIKVRLEARLQELEKEQGFRPSKKAAKAAKELVIDGMLPTAFSARSQTAVWLDAERGRIVIDSASSSLCDLIVKTLHRTFEDLLVGGTSWPLSPIVNEWLIEPPESFTLDDAVVLRYSTGKVVRFVSSDLDGPDVQCHLQKGGANVETLAMTYDDKVSFTMTTDGVLRGIKALGVITSGMKDIPAADRFDAEFSLMTLQMQVVLDAVIATARGNK